MKYLPIQAFCHTNNTWTTHGDTSNQKESNLLKMKSKIAWERFGL